MTDSLLKNSNQQVLNLKDQLNISAQRILAKDSVIKAKDDLMVLEKDQTSCRIKKRNRWIEGLGLFLLYMLIGHPGIK